MYTEKNTCVQIRAYLVRGHWGCYRVDVEIASENEFNCYKSNQPKKSLYEGIQTLVKGLMKYIRKLN